MNETVFKKPEIGKAIGNVLISETSRNGLILIIAIVFVSIMSGILGAFKNGEFQRTYDFVSVDVPVSEVDYTDDIFSQFSKDSREFKYDKVEILYDEELGENYEVTTYWYKGYYKNYFFGSSWFFLETMMNTLMVTIFYIALINYLIAKKKSDDVVYRKLTSEINDIVIEKNSVPSSTFEPFLDEWNGDRKVKQFISNIKYKLSKLERRTPFKVRKIFYKRDEQGKLIFVKDEEFLNKKIKFLAFRKGWLLQKRARHYIQTKERLNSFLSEEYILQNVVYEKVKYFKYIYPSFVYNGKNGIHKTTDEYSAITPDSKKLKKDLVAKVMLGFAVTSAFATVLSFTLFKADENWLIIVYTVILKLLPLVLQWILGIDYSNTYMSDQLIPTQKYRLSIINIYLSDKDKYVKRDLIAKDVS